MLINLLDPKADCSAKQQQSIHKLNTLFEELNTKNLPSFVINSINQEVHLLNNFEGTNTKYFRKLALAQMRILKSLEKETRLVPKNHYKYTWLAIGMASIGVPIGCVLGLTLKNMAFMGIGIPIGMGIGIAVGVHLDKKAASEGRQLIVDMKS